jgi:NADPH:quinone reductase-like Zn-dependent oxidoreductase
MKAMLQRQYGGPEVLEVGELPKPTPSDTQVLIRVEASSVNPIDWKRASGSMRLLMPVSFPAVPGYDVAGVVAEVGRRAADAFPVGTRVHARIAEAQGGACAEFALAGIEVTTRMPEGMSSAEGAALPLAGMTALQGLRDALELNLAQSSARVVVVGASGGVGHFGLQLAARSGAHVIAVCSARNADLVRRLGAKEVIDYAAPDAFAGLAPVDLVLDCVSGDSGPWMDRLTDHGRYASTVPTPGLMAKQVLNLMSKKKQFAVMLKPAAEDLAFLDQQWAKKALQVVIDAHFPLEQLGEAWKRSLSGRATGKLVIDVA